MKTRGVALPTAVFKGYRPSTDCFCSKGVCIAQFTKCKERRDHRSKRVLCSVCNSHYPLKFWCWLPSALVAETFSYFTTGNGGRRRDESSIHCTGMWLTESSSLYVTCLALLYKHRKRSGKTPTTGVTIPDMDKYKGGDAGPGAELVMETAVMLEGIPHGSTSITQVGVVCPLLSWFLCECSSAKFLWIWNNEDEFRIRLLAMTTEALVML